MLLIVTEILLASTLLPLEKSQRKRSKISLYHTSHSPLLLHVPVLLGQVHDGTLCAVFLSANP